MSYQTFTTVMHPDDVTYQMARREQIAELLKMDVPSLRQQLKYLELREPLRDDHNLSPTLMKTLRHSPMVPQSVKAGILDSTSGTTGNVLIRQDLEPTLYTLFVKEFPAFDSITKGPSNGLTHAATQLTSPANGMALGATVQTELGTVTYDAAAYARATFPIAVFAVGRGVSFKELAAVRQGGAPYDPHTIEMGMGMVQLAQDVQFIMLQGNASTSGGAGLATELGAFNVNAFDGFRSVMGSVGTYSGNNAIQVDIGSLNILESIQVGAAKARNNGGHPKTAYCTINFKQALDTEQQGNKRYTDDLVEIIPGVKVNQIQWADGQIRIIPIPGTTVGNYTRTSDNATVEDCYLIDDMTVTLRWLFSESFTVLQIPSGVDGVLSERWIVFCMFGLEQAAPLFNSKIRRISS